MSESNQFSISSSISNVTDESFQYAVVVAEFNSLITKSLADSAYQTLLKAGIDKDLIKVIWVPGAFEIPLTCSRLLNKYKLKGIVALGAVIRGSTPHFDYVAGECVKGIHSISLKYNIPIMFGVLTTNTIEEAMNRAGLKLGNKGGEAASGMLDLLDTFKQLNI